jgi:hypothetical protein
MRAVKLRLFECLPSCRTFLDVDGNFNRAQTRDRETAEPRSTHPADLLLAALVLTADLKSGSGTVELDKSGCILVFSTSQYFEKRNSFKELFRAVCQGNYILAMLEPDVTQQGGLNQVDVQDLITNAKLDKYKVNC